MAKPKKVTLWQRAVLTTMYLVEHSMFDETGVRFTRRALQDLLWFDWQSYHSDAMQFLIGNGWIVQVTLPSGIIAYHLTDAGRGPLRKNLYLAWGEIDTGVFTREMFEASRDELPF